MSSDLRTELNDCDNATGFVGDGATPAANTLTGQRYEGSASIDTQHSNADEQMHTTQLSGGGGTFSLDLSDSTCYLMVKDNLVDTAANGGVQFVIGDGTDLIGYDVGGNDKVGLSLAPFYNAYKLDVSERVTTPGANNAYTGSEASLDQTVITQMGYGSLHLAKAQGNVANVFLDRMTHITNGSPALRINGGTSGTPEEMSDVQGDDVTNGWGFINNPIGSQYTFFAPTQWGEPSANADHYFTATDEQWTLDGTDIGVGNFPFEVVSNATDTGSFVITRISITNVGARATFDLSDADLDFMQIGACTLTDLGAITMPTQVANDKFCDNSLFINCDQMDLQSLDMDGNTWIGSNNADGAIIWDENTSDVANQDDSTFQRSGTHNAIEIAPTGAGPFTYNIGGPTFDGFASQDDGDAVEAEKVFFINPSTLSADININITDGTAINIGGGADTGVDGFSFREVGSYTGTVTIQQTVTLTVTVLDSGGNAVEGARVRIENASTGALIADGETNASGVFTDATFNYTGDLAVTTKVRLKGFKNFRTAGTIVSTGLSVGVTLATDNIVDLP